MAACNPDPPKQSKDSINQTEFLTCSICEELYDDDTHQPKFLSCFHTFCSHCLTELLNRQDNQGTIPCPNCRHHTELPKNGISGLQRNFYIENKKEISRGVGQHKRGSCHKHSDQPKSFFCETCKQAICRDCTVLGHKEAAGHVIKEISDAEVFHRQALSQQVNEQQILLTQIQANIEKLDREMELLTTTKETTTEDIEKFICDVYKKVEERKRQLIEINEQTFHDAQNFMLSLRKQLQETLDMVNKNVNKCKCTLKYGALNEVISISHKLMGSTKEMQAGFVELDFGKTCISFDANEGIEAFENTLCHLAKIDFKGFVPTKFEFQCQEAIAGQKAEMQVKLFSNQDEPVPCPFKDLIVEITDLEDI